MKRAKPDKENTDMSDAVETIEKETVSVAEVVAEAPKLPTVEDVKAKGWNAREIESAQKRGMIQTPEEVKPVEKAEVKAEETPVVFKDDLDAMVKAGADLSPEQEAEFLKNRPAGNQDRGLYFRMKNERRGRQQAQEEAKKANEKAAALEARLAALEGKKEPVLDENGEEIDPEEKPLTIKQWKEMQKAEQDAALKAQQENQQRASSVTEAQKAQEEYVKTIYSDFDETANKAKEVIQNLETLIPEKWKQAKVVQLIRNLQTAAANADKIDLDEYNAAHIAYEIGQLHPDYGKSNVKTTAETGTPKSPKVNGGLTPEQMKRIEENTQRRASSASIPGGGAKRTVDAEDVGLAELNAMSYTDRQAFRAKHPDKYAKLLRG